MFNTERREGGILWYFPPPQNSQSWIGRISFVNNSNIITATGKSPRSHQKWPQRDYLDSLPPSPLGNSVLCMENTWILMIIVTEFLSSHFPPGAGCCANIERPLQEHLIVLTKVKSKYTTCICNCSGNWKLIVYQYAL